MKVTFDIPIQEIAAKCFINRNEPINNEEIQELIDHLQRCVDWEEIVSRALMYTVEL